MPKTLMAVIATVALALTGCAGAPSAPVDATTMNELRQYVTEAGINCDELEDRGQAPFIADSHLGACADDVVLAIFPDHTQTKVWSYSIHDLGKSMQQRVLIGEVWAVSAKAETLESVQLATGGVIVTDEMLEKELENN